ncbi:MAG: DedA family protein [Solirubrobacterales bacterium]|nr:DedA family protein [Solirubrobacterales bacterium]
MVAETVFPPIPSEAVLPLAGYLAQRGDFDLVAVLVTSTAGSVLGALLLYELARRGGRPFAERFLRFARLPASRLADAERAFARRGPVVVAVGRCIPGVRSLVSVPAGVLHMPRGQYLLYTLLGSAVWNGVLVGAGYVLTSEWERVSGVIGPASKPLVALAVVATAAAAVLWWVRERRLARDAD